MLLDVLVCDVFTGMPPVGKEKESTCMMKCPKNRLDEAKIILELCDILGVSLYVHFIALVQF